MKFVGANELTSEERNAVWDKLSSVGAKVISSDVGKCLESRGTMLLGVTKDAFGRVCKIHFERQEIHMVTVRYEQKVVKV